MQMDGTTKLQSKISPQVLVITGEMPGRFKTSTLKTKLAIYNVLNQNYMYYLYFAIRIQKEKYNKIASSPISNKILPKKMKTTLKKQKRLCNSVTMYYVI